VIANAAERHRDVLCRLGWHVEVRYPRALGVCGHGWQQVSDETYCRNCHRLLRRDVVMRFPTGGHCPHLMDIGRRPAKIPTKRSL